MQLDVVLSPLLQVVFDKLATPFLEEITDICGVKEELKKLRRTLRVIQTVLQDAEERQLTDKALKNWLAELKEVAYDVEDLLDECSPEVMLSGNRNRFIDQVSIFVSSLGKFANCVDMLPKIKQIKERLDVLAEEKSYFNLKEGLVSDSGSRSRSRWRRQTGSFVIESEVFGRVEDKEMIVEQLVSIGESPGKISIISIVGIGGLGKTTLAQLVYGDERVKRHFDLKIWVCVNDDFDLGKIMVLILESGSKSKCDLFGMDVLQFRLQELLFEKRYLLVLDDVWNEDHNEWDNLRTSLRSGVEGSKIIVTTRSEKVASIMGTAYIHHLKGLSDDDCWALFKQRAFGYNEDHHPNLSKIGKQIVKKCGGVPLAAKTLGSVMRFKRGEKEWFFVQDSDLWDVSESDSGILPALRLSYSHLPTHLKGCFAYCSIFPRNYIFKKEKLIQLWIAEGLLQSEGRKSQEFIGNEYFDDLVWMSFFQDVQRGDHGNIIECKMHNLIHDLAQSVAGNEYLRVEDNNIVRSLSLIRHSSVVCDFSLYTIPETLYEMKKLRTLILVFPRGDLGEVPSCAFSSFRYLRVLDLSGSGIKKLHDSISSFIFLRYLDLSDSHVETLPESVCCLYNLQVMNLSGCYNLIKLPSHTGKMFKLKHLIIIGCERLTQMPASIGNLKNLLTLSMFIVGEGMGESLSELQNLNLGGELNIRHLENVKDATEAMTANLIEKRSLQSLELSWGNDHKELNRNNDTDGTLGIEVLNYLQPHEYLKELSIKGYRGICFPEWMSLNKLPNLTELVLIDCSRCEHLPTLGRLPFLKVLYLQGMDAVRVIGKEFYGKEPMPFPSLKELTLTNFPNLEFWWTFSQREGFSSLVKLTVRKCLKLCIMPRFPLLKHLELQSCNEMILQSASNLASLTIIVIEEFREQLVFLEKLLQNNALLMSLTIGSCPKLRYISPNIGKLINLKILTIRWCEELLSLPQGLQNLTSLESLEIIECHSLISLPEDIKGLSSLRSLSIENCNNIASLPLGLQFLTALEQLAIMYCPKLDSLPNLQHLSALKSLIILNCPELVSLSEGLKHVSTLQNLEVRGCPGLQTLPEWVANLTMLRSLALSDCHNLTSLPGGLQSLSALQHLSIRECPALEERCKKDIGEDWPKINHIAHVYIGQLKFRQYETASCSSQ